MFFFFLFSLLKTQHVHFGSCVCIFYCGLALTQILEGKASYASIVLYG